MAVLCALPFYAFVISLLFYTLSTKRARAFLQIWQLENVNLNTLTFKINKFDFLRLVWSKIFSTWGKNPLFSGVFMGFPLKGKSSAGGKVDEWIFASGQKNLAIN